MCVDVVSVRTQARRPRRLRGSGVRTNRPLSREGPLSIQLYSFTYTVNFEQIDIYFKHININKITPPHPQIFALPTPLDTVRIVVLSSRDVKKARESVNVSMQRYYGRYVIQCVS